MLFTRVASVGFNQIVGYVVVVLIAAAASAAAWILNDGRKCRCPRCRASVPRFARRCGRCRREITPMTVAQGKGVRERQLLAAEVTFLMVLVVGGLVVALGNRPSPEPRALAALDQPAPSFAPPPLGQTQLQALTGHPWPIANEAPPADGSPQYGKWLEASRERAIRYHPALGDPGSVFQTAFVARYRELSVERNPRLNDPRWPEELASEVALQLADHPPRPARP